MREIYGGVEGSQRMGTQFSQKQDVKKGFSAKGPLKGLAEQTDGKGHSKQKEKCAKACRFENRVN